MTRAESAGQMQRMSPKEWFVGELGLSFWDVFDVEGFVPDAQGFIFMAETEAGHAQELGIDLRPMDVAMFLIDCWKGREMTA